MALPSFIVGVNGYIFFRSPSKRIHPWQKCSKWLCGG